MVDKLSLVIPTYNEAKNIAELCRQLIRVLDAQGLEYEIIIVDDNSPDGTWKISQDLAREENRIKVINRLNDKGLASAVVCGWARADGNILGVIDGDLQHPAQLLSEMLKIIIEGEDIDIVIASRYARGGGVSRWNIWRRGISRIAIFISSIFIPNVIKPIKDPMSGYFILRKAVIEGKNLTPIGYKILPEILVNGVYTKLMEVPYIFEERKKGGSKAGPKQYFLTLVHFIRLSRQYKIPRTIKKI